MALVGAVAVLPASLAAQSKPQPNSRQPATASKKPVAQKTPAAKTSTRKVKGSGRRSRGRFRYRLAQLRLSPQRTIEIQRALIQSGYLNREPTGKWDDATRQAMKRYQADNRLPATGLPEARSLMKLGLGPHPLPVEIDPSAPARASVGPSGSKSAPSSKPESSSGPPDPKPPEQK